MSVSVSCPILSACSNKCQGLWWGQCGVSEHYTGWNTRHPCGRERHQQQLLTSFPGRRVHARCILLAKGEPLYMYANPVPVTDPKQHCMSHKASELQAVPPGSCNVQLQLLMQMQPVPLTSAQPCNFVSVTFFSTNHSSPLHKRHICSSLWNDSVWYDWLFLYFYFLTGTEKNTLTFINALCTTILSVLSWLSLSSKEMFHLCGIPPPRFTSSFTSNLLKLL